MAPKSSKGSKAQPKPPQPDPPKEYPTIALQNEAHFLSSHPYFELAHTKGLAALTPAEKTAYAYSCLLESGVWKSWNEAQQKDFWKAVSSANVPVPGPKPRELGRDRNGREIAEYSPEQYRESEKRRRDLGFLAWECERFREQRVGREVGEGEIEEERNRRKLIGVLKGKRMGYYEGSPEWDDVMPIEQDDGEGALAQIAYSEEYAEAMSYLRAIMASNEHSPRVLDLTSHIISLNPAHYTVWLYRARTIFVLESPIEQEIEWVNEIALANQKNYQIWHHRQLLIDHLYPTISSKPGALQQLEDEERDFMAQMFDEDSKNYHVWSYRQYLVRKLNLFNAAELKSIEVLLRKDVRNNSAWSHRFFIVFSNSDTSTKGSPATAVDPKIPAAIIDREIEFAKAATFEAPQNQSPWNYLRGVLRKGGRKLASQECFASEFVIPGKERFESADGEEVRSSHALDFLADTWAEKGENNKAVWAWGLLANKYDRIRKGYWEWRKAQMEDVEGSGNGKGLEAKLEGLSVGT